MASGKFDRKMMLSLDEELYQLLNELAEVSEKPAATMVREILAAATPQIQQTVKMLRQLRQGMLSEALETQGRSVADSQLKLFEAQKQFLDAADEARNTQKAPKAPKKGRK